jgi:hypothetical protein
MLGGVFEELTITMFCTVSVYQVQTACCRHLEILHVLQDLTAAMACACASCDITVDSLL